MRIIKNKNFSDFSPILFGTEKCLPSDSYGPTMRDHYLIHFVLSGKGTFTNPKNTYKISKGQAFLIRPGEIHSYVADEISPWEYTWIGFVGNLAHKFDTTPDVFPADEFLQSEILYATKLNNGVEEYLAAMLFKLRCELLREHRSTDYVGKVINYINTNYMDDISICKIADSLNINRKYLARIFKAREGVSMQEYLITKRMTSAKNFLEQGYSVSETAQLTGYKDAFVFSKAFSKHFGMNPISYKTKNRDMS